MATNRIALQVIVGTQGATSSIVQFNNAVASIGTTAQATTTQASQAMQGMTLSIRQSISQITGAMGLLAGISLAGLARDIKETVLGFETARVGLNALAGSVQAGQKLFKEIQEFAATSPFEFKDLLVGAQRLLAFNFKAEEVIPTLKSMSGALAALGGDKDKLLDLVKALGDIRAAGHLTGQELRQLQNIPIPALSILSEKYGVSQAEFKKRMEQGQILAEDAIRGILSGMEKQFAPFGEALEKSATVALSNFSDALHQFYDEVVVLYLPKITQFINQTLIPGLKDLTKWWNENREAIEFWAKVIGVIVASAVIYKLIRQIEALGVAIKAFTLMASANPWVLLLTATLMAAGYAYHKLAEKTEGATEAARDYSKLQKQIAADELLSLSRGQTGGRFWDQPGYTGEPGKPGPLGPKTSADWTTYTVEQMTKAGLNLEQIRAMLYGTGAAGAKKEAPYKFGAAGEDEGAKKAAAAMEAAQSALEREQARSLGGIAALDFEYAKLFRKVKGYGAAEAEARKAYELAIQNEIREQQEKTLQQRAKQQQDFFNDQIQAAQTAGAFARDRAASAIADTREAEATAQVRAIQIAEQTVQKVRDLRVAAVTAAHAEEMRKLKLAADTGAMLSQELNSKRLDATKTYLRERTEAERKADEEVAQNRLEIEKQVNQEITQARRETRDVERERAVAQLEHAGQLRRAQLEQQIPQTTAEEIQRIQMLAAIEMDSAQKVHDKRQELDRKRLEDDIKRLEILEKAGVLGWGEYLDAVEALGSLHREKSGAADDQFQHDQQMKQIEMTRSTNEKILQEQRSLYDSLKSSAGRVFDALLDRSTSVWKAMANAFKTAMLTAIKEIVTSRIAQGLMGIFGGGNVRFAGTARQQILGSQPVFGLPAMAGMTMAAAPAMMPAAGAAVPIGGAPQVTSSISYAGAGPAMAAMPSMGGVSGIPGMGGLPSISFPGAPGGTPGIAGPVSIPGMGGTAAKGMSMSQQAKAAFGIGQPVKVGWTTKPWSAATPRERLGSVLSSSGFRMMAATVGIPMALSGLQKSGAMGAIQTTAGMALTGVGMAGMLGYTAFGGALLGGSIALTAMGLKRGGAAGAVMATLGGAATGALIGLRLGGPIGAAVGAVAGAAIGGGLGIARMFYKTADEKLRMKLKQVYNIDIPDAKIRQQILEIAKSKYGGNVDLAIRSPEVQELIRLYSLTQGQQVNLGRPMYPATFAQSGAGGLQQQPIYSNGQLVSSPYTGPTSEQMWSTPGTYIQLNPAQANDLFEGRVVQVIKGSPEAVGEANTEAGRSGQSRNAQRAAFLEPGTVLA